MRGPATTLLMNYMTEAKPRKLTAKQESAAQLVASGWKQIDAYRHCYDVSVTASAHSVETDSLRLFNNPAMTLRIQQLKATAEAVLAERLVWDLGRLVDEAEKNLDRARSLGQMAPANGSLELIGRVTGILGDKQQGTMAPVTQIIINLAPGVEMPAVAAPEPTVVEGESREIEDDG